MPNYTLDNEGKIISIPPSVKIPETEPIELGPVIEEESPEQPMEVQKRKNKLADLFEVPQAEDNDIYADDLTEITDEDIMGGDNDMSDLTNVSRDDIMGISPEKRRARRFKRTNRPYQPPNSLRGIRG